MILTEAMENTTEVKKEDKERDKLSEAIGEFGRWHAMLMLCITAPIRMTAIWNHMAIIFLAQKTTFWCAEDGNLSQYIIVLNSTCYSDCLRYEFHSDFQNTIISEWNLICDKAWLANFAQTICMFGVLLGSIFFGFIADRLGRRPALFAACLLQLISGFAAPFCPNYWTFMIFRFFIGAATAGTMLTSFILMMEVSGIKKRELVACLAAIPLPIGELIMPLFAYYLRPWNEFSLAIALPNFIFLTFVFIVPESPKWLISKGRLQEASSMMKKVAKWNKHPTDRMLDIAKEIAAEANINQNQKRSATYMDLVRVPSMRTKNLCSCTIWFLLGLSFYGSNQYIGQTSSNVFITISLAGILQIPGIILSSFLCKRIGRRYTVVSFSIVCAISNGLLGVPDNWFYIKLLVGSIGVSSASGAFSTMYMYTTELFPTVARNMAIGASSTTFSVGAMLAPFVAGLSFTGYWIPPTIFGIVPLGAAITGYCLPETRGKKLSDALEEK